MTATEQEETEQTTEQKNHLVFSSQNLQDIYWGGLLLACIIGSIFFLAYLSGIPLPCI